MKTSFVLLALVLGMALAAVPARAAAADASDASVVPTIIPLRYPTADVISPRRGTVPPKDPPGDTLHVDLEAFNNAVGLTAGGVFYTAARLTPTRACTVVTVIFYKWDVSNNDYLFVWGQGTPSNPGPLIESVPYTGSTTMEWQSIDLPIHVPLAANQDIWVGPRMNHPAGTFPLGVDDGPSVPTRGGWINFQGSWIELMSVGLDVNWHIRAIIGHGSALTTDVGAEAIVAPGSMVEPGPIQPKARIRNYGTDPQSNIQVKCWIDSGATRVYEQSAVYAGPLAPGSTAEVPFSPNWNAVGGAYNVTMFTDLAGDQNRANDTVRGRTQVRVQALTWSQLTAAPSPGRYWCPGTGVYRDTLWFLGGRMAAQTSTRTMTAYDIASGTWIASGLPTLLTPRRAGGGGQIGNKIYVVAGRDSASTTLNTCHEFNLDTKTSTPKANMPAASWAVASAVAGGRLYIIGNELRAGSTYEYNPAVDSWKTKASLPTGRGWACAAGARGLVYAMGGSDASGTLSDCWCLNPVTNQWTQKTSMPGPRIYALATAYNDSVIYVVGGSADGAVAADNLVYAYSIASNTWTTEAPKPTRSGWHMLNAVDGALYVAYGSDCTTPSYLTNLDQGTLPPVGIEVIDLTEPKAASRITPSVVRDFARIDYSVTRPARVALGIYNAAGELVRTLVNGVVEPGSRSATWNRTDNSGRRVAGGTYFYRLSVGGKSVSGKTVVLQ